MTVLKVVGSLTAEKPDAWAQFIWGIREDGVPDTVMQEFWNGTTRTRYITVAETCSIDCLACVWSIFNLSPCKFTIEIVGLGSDSYGEWGNHPLLFCIAPGEKGWFIGIVDPSFYWYSTDHLDSVRVSDGYLDPPNEGGYSIFGRWLRRVRNKIDLFASDDHNIPREILQVARDKIKEVET